MKKKAGIIAAVIMLAGSALFARESILINSTPQGAGVYYNGKRIGTTPLRIYADTRNAPGFFKAGNPSYDLIIAKDFYETELVSISYKAGGSDYNVKMTALPRLPLYDGYFYTKGKMRISDVFFEDLSRLAFLREEIYARYGRPVSDPELKYNFQNTRWYRENPLYSDDMLTENDKYNIKLINDFLEVNNDDVEIFNSIIRQYEFFTEDRKYSIRFINARECVITVGSDDFYEDNVIPYFFDVFDNDDTMLFVVAGQKIYMSDPYKDSINIVNLDIKNRKLISIDHIEDVNPYWW